MRIQASIVVTLVVGTLAACGEEIQTIGDDGSQALVGTLGYACNDDGSCDGQLTCEGDICQAPCGEGNSLGGTIDEVFSLAFDRVQVLKQDDALRIEYLDDVAGGTNKICKLVVDTQGLQLAPGSVVDAGLFYSVAVVERVAATGGSFPPVGSGEIRFELFDFKDGGRICGGFDVEFQDGHTLSGTFDAPVTAIPLD